MSGLKHLHDKKNTSELNSSRKLAVIDIIWHSSICFESATVNAGYEQC